jgi:hypothetical protein
MAGGAARIERVLVELATAARALGATFRGRAPMQVAEHCATPCGDPVCGPAGSGSKRGAT